MPDLWETPFSLGIAGLASLATARNCKSRIEKLKD
jgi:hypothetical protein